MTTTIRTTSVKMGLITAALGWGLLISGCNKQESVQKGGAEPGEVAEGEVPAGNTVSVTGEIEKRYDDHTFTMSGEDELLSSDLAVVSRKPLPPEAVEGTRLKVTGTVSKIGVIEVEKEVGWDFDPQVEAELENVESFLVADSVEVIAADE